MNLNRTIHDILIAEISETYSTSARESDTYGNTPNIVKGSIYNA